jgi:hypothetical protein
MGLWSQCLRRIPRVVVDARNNMLLEVAGRPPLPELTRVGRQSVVHVRRSDRGMAESHAQLMQIGHDVPCRIKAINARPLMVINFEVAVLGR